MEIALSATSGSPTEPSWPDEASLAAFRAWLQGVPSRAAVDRYLVDRRAAGASARSVIGRVKRQLAAFATSRAQADMAAVLAASSPSDRKLAKVAAAAIETLRGMPLLGAVVLETELFASQSHAVQFWPSPSVLLPRAGLPGY